MLCMLAGMNQFRSQNDGADIRYKMTEKVRKGGTLGRAPLGYMNVRDRSEGRNIGIVVLDPERADLVRTAFELYATGDYTLEQLVDELTQRGLRTRPGRFPAGPVSDSKLQVMLKDPYYLGFTTYKGEVREGRHEQLVSEELFDRVQVVLAERRGRGVKQRQHHHYLKGSLWCGQCHDNGVESRMLMQWANGNGGRYRYYFCGRRPHHQCDSRYIEGEAIEAAIVDYYGTLHFPPELADELRQMIHQTLTDEGHAVALARQQLSTELARLDVQEENLLNLAADGEMPTDKVKERLGKVRLQRARIDKQLNQADDRLALGAALIEQALQVLADPQKVYKRMGDDQRRLANQAIFEKLYVFDGQVSQATFNPPFDELLGARDAVVSARRQTKCKVRRTVNSVVPSQATGRPASLANAFFGQGSISSVMVELLGRYANLSYQGKRLRALLEMDLPEPAASSPRTPKRVCRQLTQAEVAELVASYAAGVPVDELVERFHVDQTTVQKYVRQQGLPRRIRRVAPSQVDEVIRMYGRGKSVESIAKRFNVGATTVRRVLVREGVTMRRRGRPPLNRSTLESTERS